MDMTEPLVFTSRGNLPVASLAYSVRWEENDQGIEFHEEYRLDGELVRNNVHIRLKKGLDSNIEQAVFGG